MAMVGVKQHKAYTPQRRIWILTCKVYILLRDKPNFVAKTMVEINLSSIKWPRSKNMRGLKKINCHMINNEILLVVASLVTKNIPLLIILVIENTSLPIMWWLNFFQLPHDWWWWSEAWGPKNFGHQVCSNWKFSITIGFMATETCPISIIHKSTLGN